MKDFIDGIRLLAVVWVMTMLLAFAGAARAAPEPVSTATPEERAAAQSLFDRARELMLEGKNAEACPLLEESQRLDPGLGTQFNLAACYEATGRLASAHALFVEVAAQARERGQVERERVARGRAEAVQPKLSRLSILVAPEQVDQLTIERNGENVSRAQIGVAVPVDAGSHEVRASGPGLVEWVSRIEIPADAQLHTMIVPKLSQKLLEPVVEAPPGTTADTHRSPSFWAPTHRKVGLIAGTVGVLGVSVGSIFGLRAIAKSDESDELGCAGTVCPTQEGVDARNDAQVAGNVATVSMIAGLAGLATAAVLFLAIDGTDDDATSVPVLPVASKNSGQLIWQGRF